MNELARWDAGNEGYLAAALAWLRLRLARMREATAESDAEEVEAVATLRAAETFDPPPAMLILGKRFGLSSYEQQVLLLCAAMELDTRIPALCANAQDDPGRPYPTFALTMALFDEPTWDAHLPDRPLRYWRLIEINQPGAQPLTASPLRADERVVNYLKGLNTLDDRLTPLMEPLNIEADGVDLPPSQQTTIEAVIRNIEAPAAHSPVVALLGSDGPSKQLVASRAAARFGLSLYRLPAELLPAQTAELEELARLWGRESILLPVALYLDAQEVDEASKNGDSGHAAALRRFLARTAGLLFLDIRELWPRLGREVVPIDVSKPMPGEQREAWEDILGPGADGSPYQLAGQFDMNLPMIQKIARTALSEVSENGGVIQSRLWEACLVGTRPRLDVLARRIDPLATWDDIVLPKEEMGLLHQIADQVGQRSRVYEDWGYRRKMNRGLGISALFAGESGTGKTMAAEVIANDLHLNLYLIDLSAVVSKYIGETEKNLRGRRSVRQTQRGQGQPRPLRQHRDQLPAATHGGLSRAGDPGDQHEKRPGSSLYAPATFHCQLSIPYRRRSQTHLDEGLSVRDADGRAGLRAAGPPQPDRREYSQHLAERSLSGGTGGGTGEHAARPGSRPERVPQTGASDQ